MDEKQCCKDSVYRHTGSFSHCWLKYEQIKCFWEQLGNVNKKSKTTHTLWLENSAFRNIPVRPRAQIMNTSSSSAPRVLLASLLKQRNDPDGPTADRGKVSECAKILIFVGNQRNGKEKHRHLLRLSREGTGKNQEVDLHQVWRGHRTMGKDTLPTGVKIYLKVTWHHVLMLKMNLGIWHIMWGHVHQKTHVRIFITAGLGIAENLKKLKQPQKRP